MKSTLFYLLLLLFISYSCKTGTKRDAYQVTSAFYHWKTIFSPSDMEVRKLDSLGVKKLYCKFFDVEWNRELNEIRPTAIFKLSNSLVISDRDIVPTIFITNESLYHLQQGKEVNLADKIAKLYSSTVKQIPSTQIKEIQIDCDWTEATRDKYFNLLTALKEKIAIDTWSATIRLHQIKFMSKTGVPPVNRGMLMCYNMGNLRDAKTGNSIIEIKELEKYTANISTYPLDLDVAYPLFEWAVLFRKGNFQGLMQHLQSNFFSATSFSAVKNGYQVTRDTTIEGVAFVQGDFIRVEKSDLPTIKKADKIIRNLIKNHTYAVSFYHLDSIILEKFSINELKSFSSSSL